MQNSHTQKIIVLASAYWSVLGRGEQQAMEQDAIMLSTYLLGHIALGKTAKVLWFVNRNSIVEPLQQHLQRAGCPQSVEFIVLEASKLESIKVGLVVDNTDAANSTVTQDEAGQQQGAWLYKLSHQLRMTITQQHPAVLELWPDDAIGELPIWYYGIEVKPDALQHSDIDSLRHHYGKLLPQHHQAKGQTWLAMLLDEYGNDGLERWSDYQHFLLIIISLAKLLHEFDEICENGHSALSFSDAAQMGTTPLYLGSKLSEDEIFDLDDYDHSNEEDQTAAALELYINRSYSETIGIPAGFMGKNDLFYTLWISTWPVYSQPVEQRLSELFIGNVDVEISSAYGYFDEIIHI
jgi:hypothetical protein